jgi:hypoxanthine phosphoribosyltransferase
MSQILLSNSGTQYKLLHSMRDVKAGIDKQAEKIVKDFENSEKPPILMGVITGGIYTMVDLSRILTSEFSFEHHIDTIALHRYGDGEQGGAIKFVKDPSSDIGGRDIILVEDLIEKGLTLHEAIKILRNLKNPPNSIRVFVLGIKKDLVSVDLVPDYCCFEFPNEWIVGYGMDDAQSLRGLEGIYVKV